MFYKDFAAQLNVISIGQPIVTEFYLDKQILV